MKRVLVAPLDWGLGHATRCIPIIMLLLNRKCEVLLAGSGASLLLLRAEFPALKYFYIPPYNPVYPSNGSMVVKMVTQIPKFFQAIRAEHKVISNIIDRENIDLVISDNRYGCWSTKIPSVFITHQSNILMPKRFGWLAGIVRKINEGYMMKFTRCWIPDFRDGVNLAGELVFGKENVNLQIDYIGPLSRFKPSGPGEKKYDITAIFSGPEPQRTLLERIVMPQLKSSGLKYFVVRGILSSSQPEVSDHQADFLTANQLQQKIEASDIILARSGYSTVMDLATLDKKAIFIPTPGQTEQEYLAGRMMEKGIAFYMKQDSFALSYALEQVKNYSGFTGYKAKHNALEEALDKVLNQRISTQRQ